MEVREKDHGVPMLTHPETLQGVNMPGMVAGAAPEDTHHATDAGQETPQEHFLDDALILTSGDK